MVTLPLRILLLEDDPTDAALVQELLEADGIACEITRVQKRADYLCGLKDPAISLILADFKLPSFDGLSALELAQNLRPDLPFIFVSGTLGEELAIEALKIGATDYVLKSRLSRLAPSVKRALREAADRVQRKQAEEALRRSEMYLAEAQALSHTGSFGWDILSGEIFWSDETYRIFEVDPTTKPTVQVALERTHPDDRPYLRRVIEQLAPEKGGFSAEHRLRMPSGSVKHIRVVARRAASEDSEHVLFIGAVTDITERKRAEEQRERLRQLEGDLARINRVSTMGELAASLAHEIKQPVAGIAANATAVSNWLRHKPPNIEEACESASQIINGAHRVAHIVDRNRALYSREKTQRELLDLNEIIGEMVILLRDAAHRHSISIRSELDPALPATSADRVQLQQVLMNLMLNGIEAMKEDSGELSITSTRTKDGDVLVAVTDSGIGLPEAGPEQIFEAFFTTKPDGTGMGLSISRRIIESHGGRLWASANAGRGATFQLTLPMEPSVGR
jgi:signal transduction histidine kinase/FixJ family two-component response regulator